MSEYVQREKHRNETHILCVCGCVCVGVCVCVCVGVCGCGCVWVCVGVCGCVRKITLSLSQGTAGWQYLIHDQPHIKVTIVSCVDCLHVTL